MRYQHPDLNTITAFLEHSSMDVAKRTDDEVWYKGYGVDPISTTEGDLQRRNGRAKGVYHLENDGPKIELTERRAKVRQFNRFTPGTAAVHKLGHVGLCVESFDEQPRWYTETFNFAPTDFLYTPTEGNGKKNVATFMHIDRGDEAVGPPHNLHDQ
ncbi:hypothetical protein LTR17_015756 [Elasticomyces elasticus]|nr:hypothetical protein LTR17_015756 [Elasticomyces elasticus]